MTNDVYSNTIILFKTDNRSVVGFRMSTKRRDAQGFKKNGILFLIAVITCLILLLGWYGWNLYKKNQVKDPTEITQTMVEKVNDVEEPDPEESGEEEATVAGVPIPAKNLDWEDITAENPDIYAWLYVPGTDVDYPVFQSAEDDTYYLEHNIDGSPGLPGCVYSEHAYNGTDFTDNNTVLYGHTMKNGTMFTSLHNFEDENLFSKDNYIFIYTPEKVFVYEIFGAYETSPIHLLANSDMTDPDVYDEYLMTVFSNAKYNGRVVNIRDDIKVTKKDRIITLSTCTLDGVEAYRYVVQGVLVGSGTFQIEE